MNISLSEKLKSLRKEKNVSQEKLAEYLGVSFQAVSKWENGNTYPDILLLPDIARFYGITIDELLQVEKIDEQRLVDEFEDQAEALCRNGDYEQALELCKKMYKKMPNNIEIKEHLMSLYYDVDKIKYQNEIIDLGNEIYNMDHPSNYYKGQVCNQLAVLYSYLGKEDMAEKSSYEEPQQFYIPPKTSGVSNFYKIHLRFREKLDLANVHAYKIVLSCSTGNNLYLSYGIPCL